MAKSIKGIQVKIGAETTGLKRALSDVEKQSRSIGKELYKVNRGLRFNPNSTELLSQKQDLLKDRIEATSKKLKTLKEAQDDIKKQYKKGEIDDGQYRAFQRELVTTENKLENFNGQLKETEKRSKEAKYNLDGLKEAGKMAGKAIAAAGAAIAIAGKKMYDLSKQTADYADEIDKAAQRTDLSTQAIQEWNYIAEKSDTNLSNLENTIQRLQRNVATAADGTNKYSDIMNDLGVNVLDTDGNLRSMNDIFPETIEALAEMENKSERNATAMELFGRSGSDLIPILNNTSGELEDLRRNFDDLDIGMNESDIQDWVEFKDTMGDVNEQFQMVKFEIATGFLPLLKNDFIPMLQDEIIPLLLNTVQLVQAAFGTSFSWDTDKEVFAKILGITDPEEAKKWLNEIKEERKKTLDELAEYGVDESNLDNPPMQWGYQDSQDMNDLLVEYEKQEDIMEELEKRIEILKNYRKNINDSLNEVGSGGDDSGGEDEPKSNAAEIAAEIMDLAYQEKILDMEGFAKDLMELDLERKQKLRGVESDLLREAINDYYNARETALSAEYTEDARQQRADIMANKFELEEISLDEYKTYLNNRLNEYEKFSNDWMKIKKKLMGLEQPDEDEEEIIGFNLEEFKEKYNSALDELIKKNEIYGDSFDLTAEKSKLLEKKINELIAAGETDSEFFNQLVELYREINKSESEEQVKALNWIAQGFNDIGYEIEEANQAFEDMKQNLSDGLSEAIVQGESLGDVFENVADQFSKMVIQKAIVDPLLDWGMGKIGIPTFHDGGLVSPRTALENMQRFHTGGGYGLKSNEQPAILEYGERVLTEGQNKTLESMSPGGKTEIHNHINAMDAQSFANFVSRNPEAIVGVVTQDIMRNGATRKAIKKS